MKIVLAPNAFKESLGAPEAARAMARGFAAVLPAAELIECPVADGGDGTADVLMRAIGGTISQHVVTGPLGEPVVAALIRLDGSMTAGIATDVIEMAKTSGLALVPAHLRNPMLSSTFGLGELIDISRKRGARRIIIALGGSATVDGGAGMAQGLGFELLDAEGNSVSRGGGGLGAIAQIIAPKNWSMPPTDGTAMPEILAACDVTNPLLGVEGAAAIFGPQKGATPEMVPELESGLANLAMHLQRIKVGSPFDIATMPSGGAAGGLGTGLAGFLGAHLRSGADLVLETIDFRSILKNADWVVTGEGKLDRQTLNHKAPAAVARLAQSMGIPVIGLAGCVEPELAASSDLLESGGWQACLSIVPGPLPLEESMRRTEEFLENACRQLGRLISRR